VASKAAFVAFIKNSPFLNKHPPSSMVSTSGLGFFVDCAAIDEARAIDERRRGCENGRGNSNPSRRFRMASKQNRKWIPGIDPEEPVTSAAGRTLEARLAQVSHYAPLAATRSAETTEYVHQLRVATRRAAAALRVFADSPTEKNAPRRGRRARL
jgi:hypothetical protein